MDSKALKWAFEPKPRFEKAVRRLDNITKKRVEQAIRELTNSEDPESLGKPLKAELSGVFSYRLGKYRFKYVVDRNANTISGIDIDDREGSY